MTWYLVPSLASLRAEVNARWPNRDKSSDGAVGDESHAERPSGHNPDYAHGGAVRAIDLDVDDNDPASSLRTLVIAAAKGDPRVWYIISDGVIWSRTYGWVARRYTGANPHTKHVHVSAVEDRSTWTDTSPWFEPTTPRWKPADTKSTLALVQRQFQIVQGMREGTLQRMHGIGWIQNALNVKFLGKDEQLVVDGFAGRATVQAWRRFESAHKGTGSKGTPDPTSLKALQIAYRFVGPETT